MYSIASLSVHVGQHLLRRLDDVTRATHGR